MACIHSGLLVPLPDIRRWRGKAHNLCKPTKIKYKNKKYRQIHMNCSAQCEKWRILWLQTANAKMGERMQQRLATDCGQKRYHDGPYLWPNRTLSITYGMYAVHTRTSYSERTQTHTWHTHTHTERTKWIYTPLWLGYLNCGAQPAMSMCHSQRTYSVPPRVPLMCCVSEQWTGWNDDGWQSR